MKTFKIQPVLAKSIKKAMKIYGISVLRCSQNKLGVTVTVTPDSKEKTIKFFNEFDLTTRTNANPIVVSCGANYVDFGTVFNLAEV